MVGVLIKVPVMLAVCRILQQKRPRYQYRSPSPRCPLGQSSRDTGASRRVRDCDLQLAGARIPAKSNRRFGGKRKVQVRMNTGAKSP